MRNPHISFSIVICTLNNYSGLEKCVASICSQAEKPDEIIVVHGESGGNVVERLLPILVNENINLIYVKSIRSLVIQRNKGIDHATGDVVFFLDDDVVLDNGYFENIMNVYRQKWDCNVGGVQGIIIEIAKMNTWTPIQIFCRLFLLGRISGRGTLMVSGNAAFLGKNNNLSKVDVFSGCMMSFRRDVLQLHRFNENFRDNWIYDDVDLSYRISREYDLYQTPAAKLHHHSSSASYEGRGKIARMSAVNRYYLFRKYFSHSRWNWCLFIWSNIGEAIVNIMQTVKHRNPLPIMGFFEGWSLIIKNRVTYL